MPINNVVINMCGDVCTRVTNMKKKKRFLQAIACIKSHRQNVEPKTLSTNKIQSIVSVIKDFKSGKTNLWWVKPGEQSF